MRTESSSPRPHRDLIDYWLKRGQSVPVELRRHLLGSFAQQACNERRTKLTIVVIALCTGYHAVSLLRISTVGDAWTVQRLA
jgi:hypothetical protein